MILKHVCMLMIEAALLLARKSSIPFEQYSPAQDERILKLYEGLRLADVTDGLDIVGLQDVGLMNPEIRPLWRDTETFEHRIVGIAVTARYVPTNKRAAKMTPEEFKRPAAARGIRPGRNELESVNRPVMCGGVLVRPGDVMVPREQAEAVAKAARQILESDKAGWRGLYQKLGMKPDKTVQ